MRAGTADVPGRRADARAGGRLHRGHGLAAVRDGRLELGSEPRGVGEQFVEHVQQPTVGLLQSKVLVLTSGIAVVGDMQFCSHGRWEFQSMVCLGFLDAANTFRKDRPTRRPRVLLSEVLYSIAA